MRFDLRLTRLEGSLRPADRLSRLTMDELHLAVLDVCRAIVANEKSAPEDVADARARVAGVEASIREQAAARVTPLYRRHLEFVAAGRSDYVAAICGPGGMVEYHDLEKPRVMERRAAILARPDVQALVAEAQRGSSEIAGAAGLSR